MRFSILFLSHLLVSTTTAFLVRDADKASKTSLSAERKPWNVFQFVQQSSRFVSTPFSSSSTKVLQPGDSLNVNFSPLDDVVMGGASSSNIQGSKWTGTVTDANNGGFLGIRSTPGTVYDLSKCKGIELKLKLNAAVRKQQQLRFKLGLRDSTEFNGIVWNASFDLTPNKISVVKIPFDTLIANLFARRVVDGQTPLNQATIAAVQLIYSKFEYDGDLNPNFQLGDIDVDVLEIRAY